MFKTSRFTEGFSRIEFFGLFFLAASHLLAAWFSFGYHHPDEHYQIWEWANYFAGVTDDLKRLPWEFGAQIRPWMQPLLHAAGIKLLLLLHAFDPFTTAFGYRAMYAFANIIGILSLWKVMKEKFSLSPWWFLFIGAMWFFPYIHARTSSENLCGILITFAFAYYLRSGKMFWTGLLFGFSFLARYQIALGLVGFGLALLYRARRIEKSHFVLLLGFLIPVALGVLLDRFGYGNWVFTPYRYFTVNLVQGVAATFNPYPWYQYFIWIAQLNPLVSFPLLVGVILYVRKQKVDELGMFVLFFVVLHFFITNKEYRFLFPVLNLVPFLAAVGFQNSAQAVDQRLSRKGILIPYLAISALGFTISAMRGAAINTLWPVHAVARIYSADDIWITDRNLVEPGAFYSLPPIHMLIYHNGPEAEALISQNPHAKVLLDGSLNDAITTEMKDAVEKHCEYITSSYPRWVYRYREQVPAIRKFPYQAIYQCP